jgi:hypothetical protein
MTALAREDRPIPSSERILLESYDSKCSVKKKLLVASLKGLDAKITDLW